MKKILCTGSAGFIFSNFAYYLKDRTEYNVIHVDQNAGNFVKHVGDIADPIFVDRIFAEEKPDYVIHGAAESFVDTSIVSATKFVHSNVMGTQVIVDSCIKHNVNRLIYISTDEVYGHLTNRTDRSFEEICGMNPRNPYSATKAAGEMIVRAAANTHGLKYNITRSCNNYGPNQPIRNLVPIVIYNILNNKEVPVYGTGEQIREWIYVQDNCAAILHILNNAPENETYNISTPYEITNLEMVFYICDIIGQGKELVKFVKDRPGHDFRYSISSQKLRDLGWEPTITFHDGLEKTVRWYQDRI
jgi:dTDP-glucose 4,6-dehydratase